MLGFRIIVSTPGPDSTEIRHVITFSEARTRSLTLLPYTITTLLHLKILPWIEEILEKGDSPNNASDD